MIYSELYEQVCTLAENAAEDDRSQLTALILFTLYGAMHDDKALRNLARHVAQFADDLLKGIDAQEN